MGEGGGRGGGGRTGFGEKVGGRHLEADAEEGVEFEGQVVAVVAEGADLGLVGGDGGGKGLLGFVVEEFAEVEGSGGGGGCVSGTRSGWGLKEGGVEGGGGGTL